MQIVERECAMCLLIQIYDDTKIEYHIEFTQEGEFVSRIKNEERILLEMQLNFPLKLIVRGSRFMAIVMENIFHAVLTFRGTKLFLDSRSKRQ